MKTIRNLIPFLTSIFLLANPVFSLAQAQNSVGGTANGASANTTANVAGIDASVTVLPVAPVTLPAQGGSDTNQVASVFVELGVKGVVTVLSTDLVANSTSGSLTQTSAHSESVSTINNLNILNGLVTATTIQSKSSSNADGSSATSSSAGSFANRLRIAGVLYEQSEFAPNTRVSANATIQVSVGGLPVLVPMTGTVTINEQAGSSNGTTSSSLTVNFLHVSVSGSVAGSISLSADIIVATAGSSVNFAATSPPSNHPPILNVPGPQTVQAGKTLQFAVSATDSDAGDSVTLAASNLPQHASFNQTSGNPATGQFSFPTSSSDVGTVAVSFIATDNHGAATSASVQITVTNSPPANHPPIISVPGPQTIGVGKTLTFTVTATDPDGDSVTLSSDSLPTNASFNATTGMFSFTPSSSQAGLVLMASFTATDTAGASSSASVQITVTTSGEPENIGPPIISVPPSPIIAPTDITLVFGVTATSPRPNCAVPISASGLPDHSSFDPVQNRFSFTPDEDQKDHSFVITFTATDCAGKTATATVTIIVISTNLGGVLAPGHICVPVTKIFFDTAPANGSCGFVTVSLTNAGAGMLRITSIAFLDGTHFRLEGPATFPLALQSASVVELKIMFQPKTAGTLHDTLTITSDDPAQPAITIELKGKGGK